MIYWHVERDSLCIHSQLKSPSSSEVASMIEGVVHHCTEMEVDLTQREPKSAMIASRRADDCKPLHLCGVFAGPAPVVAAQGERAGAAGSRNRPKTGFPAKAARPGLALALEVARGGDQLVVWRLDRLGRSMSDLIALTRALQERGVELRTSKSVLPISTSCQARNPSFSCPFDPSHFS